MHNPHKMEFNIILLLLLINTGLGESDSHDLKDIVFELKEQKEQMTMMVAMMNESINNLMADNNAMANSLLKVISDNQKLEERVNHLTLSQAEKHALNFISFTAYASETRSYEEGDTVIFDQEVVDYGDSFSPDSSIFTCPVSAYYLFHASLLSGNGNNFASRMYLDDTYIIGAFSDGYQGTYDTGSMLIVTRCEEGSSVRIRALPHGGVMAGEASGRDRQSMFTGTFLALV